VFTSSLRRIDRVVAPSHENAMRIWWNLDDTPPEAPAEGARMAVDSISAVICFGPYRLDRLGGRLFRGARHLPLRLKTFAVLEYLATRPDRLVGRDELLDALWPGTHVTPSVLAGCIRELRRALHDDARMARFIETAHRRGYRFIGAPTAPQSGLEAARAVVDAVRTRGGDADLTKLVRRIARAVATLLERQRRTTAALPRRNAALSPARPRAPSTRRTRTLRRRRPR
jgi:DNA-binding winged helix-turn-helix (wHTH) protein